MNWKKIFSRALFLGFALGDLLILVLMCNILVIYGTENQLYDNVEDIPANEVCMVLGTSGYRVDGSINFYFKYRVEAVAELYHAGKIKYIIVSGDNHSHTYDEPQMMKDYLVNKLGVPACRITCDYAGFRTLDSVVRTWKIFGQKKFTIVSQKFHNQRAVFIANSYGLDVVAFNAKDVSYRSTVKLREFFAKSKAVLDLYVLFKQPKFLGKKEKIVTCH